MRSVTGYWIRLPVSDVGRLPLATQVGGASLSAGTVSAAPGRARPARVLVGQVVDRIGLQTTPWWWQPPFPVGGRVEPGQRGVIVLM